QLAGGDSLELHIVVDKKKLASTGITLSDVIARVKANNVKIPAGTIKQGRQEYNITMDSEMKSIKQFKELEIANIDGKRIYLKDIAELQMTSKEKRTLAFFNGQSAVSMKIVKKGKANSVEVVNRVKKRLEELQKNSLIPGSVKVNWFVDEAKFTEASVVDAFQSVVLGIILTGIILFIFLHEIRSTLIVAVTMPVSIIFTFGVMRLFGYTLNNPTLLALGTSVGTLVTNSIVVIENIFVKLADSSPEKAAIEGTSEVALPVFASAMTNVVVFVPIALMSSIIGKYFAPFAVTMTAATLISLFVSFTLTPLLASKFLQNKMSEHKYFMRKYTEYWNKYYEKTEKAYYNFLKDNSSKSFLFSTFSILLLLLTLIFVAPKVGLSFFPENDKGEFILKLEFPTDTNLNANVSQTLNVEREIRKLPEVISTAITCGKVQGIIGQVSEGVFLSEIYVKTTDKNRRKMNLDEMKTMFRNFLNKKTNFKATVNVPSPVGGSSSQVEIEISGNEQKTLERLALQVEKTLKNSAILTDVDTNIRPGKPELKLLPENAILKELNLDSYYIGELTRCAVDGIKAGTYKTGDRSFDIRVITKEMNSINDIKNINFFSRNNTPINIDSVTKKLLDKIPIQIVRVDKRKTAKIYANPLPSVPLETAANFAKQNISQILPGGYTLRFAGQIEKMKEGQADFLFAIVSAIILTYLLIAASIESWTQPIMIMATVPLALIGLFIALYFAGMSLSMMGLLGFVMLIGIVVNNAILIIDEVNSLSISGYNNEDIVFQASRRVFRPIIMSSIATVVGIIPMAFGKGLGSELRSSCGMGILGGLISSTVLSLFIIPIVYNSLFIKKQRQKK
ncbi:MAG TPA: efflux RND transporter permease subunit, partial [Victivallales bacterium]|nr:efflux RND transporter permease subunit [Victivallales bacterium]